jgi:GT2 family glycosyltransferase
VEAVRSLLAGDDPIELIVVDQSEANDTEDALAVWKSEPRFQYIRSRKRGKGIALNEGIRAARGSIIVCTDDDCAVPLHWVRDMARSLEAHPTAAILFCNVTPVAHDNNAGYVPSYERTKGRMLRSVSALRDGLGLGAGMALRRDVALALGGFDESFGPGARFPSADEWDISIRALLSGWHIYETPEISIVHDGFRTFEQGKAHAQRDWIALGAVCAKPLRAGHLGAIVIPIWMVPSKLFLPPLVDLLRLRKPRGFARIVGFFRGFAEGLSTGVDPETLRFLPPPEGGDQRP